MTDLCPTILIIEDEPPIRRVLYATLQASGYQVIAATTGQEGFSQAATRQPALILLDLGLPDLDGLEVTRRLREWATMPIIILSARGRESDKIAALDAGADDYVTKPFGMGELLARLRVAVRRASPAPDEPVITTGDISVDLAAKRVRRAGEDVRLTPTEWQLLEVLVRNRERLVTQRHL